MSTTDAADEILSLSNKNASQLLTEVSDDFAVKIRGKLDTEDATDILEAGVDNGLADELGALLNDVDDE